MRKYLKQENQGITTQARVIERRFSTIVHRIYISAMINEHSNNFGVSFVLTMESKFHIEK